MDGYLLAPEPHQAKNTGPLPSAGWPANQASASVDGGEDRSERLRVEAEGAPTAIAYAVWKGQQRERGRPMVEARCRLVDYYESTP